jgi:hypothetical protein
MRKWRETRGGYAALSPEERRKDNCRSYANIYKKRGVLVPRPCEVCGAKAEMHHPDYNMPLNVEWLCHECHTELHRLLADAYQRTLYELLGRQHKRKRF